MNPNVLQIDSYDKDIAATATPENLIADSGTQWTKAKEVILKAAVGNTTPLLVGSEDSQTFPLAAGEEVRLSSILNKQSQPARYLLKEIFVAAQTNGDDVHILLIDPEL